MTDDELAEIRRLRGQGWSQQRIANELDLSRQTIGYQLKKLSLETSSSKPVRVIHTKSVSSGPRVFTLGVRAFEKERQNEVVYQIGPDVYELRSGCMHHTRLEGDASGCDYSDWVSLMQKVPDTSILETYHSKIHHLAKDKINVSDNWFKFLKPDPKRLLSNGYSNYKKGKAKMYIPPLTKSYQNAQYTMIINGNEYPYDSSQYATKPQTSIFGLDWLERNGEDFHLFNDIDINRFLREVIDERVEAIPSMELKLTGDKIKDILEIHHKFGSYEGMIDSLTPARVFLVSGPGRISNHLEGSFERRRTRFVDGIIREAIERMRQTESSKTD